MESINELFDPREPYPYGPNEGDPVTVCPACGEEPMQCDCDTRAEWGDREE